MIQKYLAVSIIILLLFFILMKIVEKLFKKISYKSNIIVFKKEYKITSAFYDYLNKENFNLCELYFIKSDNSIYDLMFNNYNNNGKKEDNIIYGKGTIGDNILKIELKVKHSYMLLIIASIINLVFQVINFSIFIHGNYIPIYFITIFIIYILGPVVIVIKFYREIVDQINSIDNTINIYNKAYCT